MAESTKVVAHKRDRAGKGGARSSRREGLIPAVIYGDKQPPMMIAVEPKSIEREMQLRREAPAADVVDAPHEAGVEVLGGAERGAGIARRAPGDVRRIS